MQTMRAEGTLTAIEKASIEAHKRLTDKQGGLSFFEIFKAGYEQAINDMTAEARERVVKVDAGGYPYIECNIELYDYDTDTPLANAGDKVKVIIIKD